MTNGKHTLEFFRDQYGHVYAWRKRPMGKRSAIIINARHSEATSEEKTLIAAAPDLLAALEDISAHFSTDESGTFQSFDLGAEVCASVLAAIRKAKGE